MSTQIEDTDIHGKAKNALLDAGYETTDELVSFVDQWGEDSLHEIDGLGEKRVEEVKDLITTERAGEPPAKGDGDETEMPIDRILPLNVAEEVAARYGADTLGDLFDAVWRQGTDPMRDMAQIDEGDINGVISDLACKVAETPGEYTSHFIDTGQIDPNADAEEQSVAEEAADAVAPDGGDEVDEVIDQFDEPDVDEEPDVANVPGELDPETWGEMRSSWLQAMVDAGYESAEAVREVVEGDIGDSEAPVGREGLTALNGIGPSGADAIIGALEAQFGELDIAEPETETFDEPDLADAPSPDNVEPGDELEFVTGQYIRAKRKNGTEMSAADLGEKVGISSAFTSKLERGVAHASDDGVYERIAEALEMDDADAFIEAAKRERAAKQAASNRGGRSLSETEKELRRIIRDMDEDEREDLLADLQD